MNTVIIVKKISTILYKKHESHGFEVLSHVFMKPIGAMNAGKSNNFD